MNQFNFKCIIGFFGIFCIQNIESIGGINTVESVSIPKDTKNKQVATDAQVKFNQQALQAIPAGAKILMNHLTGSSQPVVENFSMHKPTYNTTADMTIDNEIIGNTQLSHFDGGFGQGGSTMRIDYQGGQAPEIKIAQPNGSVATINIAQDNSYKVSMMNQQPGQIDLTGHYSADGMKIDPVTPIVKPVISEKTSWMSRAKQFFYGLHNPTVEKTIMQDQKPQVTQVKDPVTGKTIKETTVIKYIDGSIKSSREVQFDKSDRPMRSTELVYNSSGKIMSNTVTTWTYSIDDLTGKNAIEKTQVDTISGIRVESFQLVGEQITSVSISVGQGPTFQECQLQKAMDGSIMIKRINHDATGKQQAKNTSLKIKDYQAKFASILPHQRADAFDGITLDLLNADKNKLGQVVAIDPRLIKDVFTNSIYQSFKQQVMQQLAVVQ